MIYINPARIQIDAAWQKRAEDLTKELLKINDMKDRRNFIDGNRDDTWGHSKLLEALCKLAGHKCWYSEVPLEGADPNIDHFRPKGTVSEIDENKNHLRKWEGGYWWLAFDWHNFRLSSQHANQRRIDETTDGGKSNYFPVKGSRCPEKTEWDMIEEKYFALDPCSKSDVALIWFTPEGMPIVRKQKSGMPDPWEERRVNLSIWLYHLDKNKIVKRRRERMNEVKLEIEHAHRHYEL